MQKQLDMNLYEWICSEMVLNLQLATLIEGNYDSPVDLGELSGSQTWKAGSPLSGKIIDKNEGMSSKACLITRE